MKISQCGEFLYLRAKNTQIWVVSITEKKIVSKILASNSKDTIEDWAILPNGAVAIFTEDCVMEILNLQSEVLAKRKTLTNDFEAG